MPTPPPARSSERQRDDGDEDDHDKPPAGPMPSAPAATGKKRRGSEAETKDINAETSAVAAPKRQRVSRACDQCRGAREKCDGIQPRCFPCASQNRQCSWEEPKKKRGVQTGYIRTLEMALGWIFDKIPGSEDALHDLITHEGGQGRVMLVGKDSNAGNRLHRRWQKSKVHQEIDRVLSGGDVAIAKTEKHSVLDDSDSAADTEMPPRPASIPLMASAMPPTDPLALRGNNPTAQPDIASLAVPPARVKLPPRCWRLLDVYFSYTHCWFPVLDRMSVMKTSYSYRGEGLSMSREQPGSACHAELWAALALASYQDRAGDRGDERGEPAEALMAPADIYRIARSLIPAEDGHLEARHVSALLSLTLVNIAQGELNAAWILIGLASRIALGLGLHAQGKMEGSQQPHRGYMGCFILDTVLAIRLAVPPHLRAEDSLPPMASRDDDQDEWESWLPAFGVQQTQAMHSRCPAHSTSSLNSLYEIHRALSANLLAAPDNPMYRGDSYLMQVQPAINKHSPRTALAASVTHGGRPHAPLPSIYILRLAFLCFEARLAASNALPLVILQCLEAYISNFGVCSIPPLFAIYMSLVPHGEGLEGLSLEEKSRWRQVKAAVDSVWAPPSLITSPRPVGLHLQPSSFPSSRFRHGSTSGLANAQVPAPCSYYANVAPDISPAAGHEVFHTPEAPVAPHLVIPPSAQPLDFLNPIMTPPVHADFDSLNIPEQPSQHFPAHDRPSFSSGTFDYDAMLDDIASLDRSDRMESDPQFMTNLGFAPGSNLADVLTHDFMGFT